MDLKKCPSCKNMIAAESAMCPICGCEKDRRGMRLIGVVVVVLLCAAWATVHFLHR